ncbi:hypothetical protein P5673_015292 [Acropora cervicornis]|uniref:Uncharacterized protein n=1 Tax=Acropora cervicornis TaxID=6130 RepID=A0AAD9QII5_ACRCE|nr:hypothetical protein P5673_015292 [Acropora cervicornis]
MHCGHRFHRQPSDNHYNVTTPSLPMGMISAARQTCALLFLTGQSRGKCIRCAIDEKKNNLKVNKIDGLSRLHNFTWDDKGLCV